MNAPAAIAVTILMPPLWFGVGVARGAELPAPVPISRYQALIDKSPFAVATPVVPPVAPATASFADSLYIIGITRVGNDYFVAVSSKDRSQKFCLISGEKGTDGISLVSVEWDPSAEKSRVKLQKGSERGEILFDQGAIRPNGAAIAQQQAKVEAENPGSLRAAFARNQQVQPPRPAQMQPPNQGNKMPGYQPPFMRQMGRRGTPTGP